MTQILLFYQRQPSWEIYISTWKCKIHHLKMYFLLEMGLFHYHFRFWGVYYQLPMISILPWLRKEKTHRFVAVACFMLLCWYGEMVLVKPPKFLCGEKTTRDVFHMWWGLIINHWNPTFFHMICLHILLMELLGLLGAVNRGQWSPSRGTGAWEHGTSLHHYTRGRCGSRHAALN